jgi:DNA-binding HxlR family transcriptional regulator
MAKKKRKTSKSKRRSPCPIACTLDVLGDKWTLIVVRDLLLGRSRFKEFLESPENIPTNILAERLSRLLENDIVEQIPAEQGSKRMAYRLTEKGQALRPVLRAMVKWGLRWEPGTRTSLRAKSN